MSDTQPTVPYGYCECGCGQETTVSASNSAKYGWVKGVPMRYVRGHATRGKPVSTATRARIGAAHRGRPKTPEQRAKMSAAQRGPAGNNWRGGRITREGRVLVYVGHEHPLADTYGYVYEHRLVFAEATGRLPASTEHVHHVDLDPTNNDASNLVALTASEHSATHCLIRAGMHHLEALRLAVGCA